MNSDDNGKQSEYFNMSNSSNDGKYNKYCQWSEDDEAKLLDTVKCIGRNWSSIQKLYFPSLTTKQIKNKFYNIRRRKSDSSIESSTFNSVNSSISATYTSVESMKEDTEKRSTGDVSLMVDQLMAILGTGTL